MARTKLSPISQILQFILIYATVCCRGEINMTEYKHMPALYKFDNYYDCLSRKENELKYPAKYCMISVEIQPNNDSSVWQQIELLRADKFNYRHDYASRGLCLERCKDLLRRNVNDANFHSDILINEQTQMFKKFYNTNLDRRMRYDYQKEIHECVNREYVQIYNLSTKTFVDYCIDPQQGKELDIYFALTLLLVIAIFLIIILSTRYDAKLKSQSLRPDDNKNYFKVKHTDKVNRCLTAFSLYRNYNRLVMPIKGDIGSDLSFLDGLRSIVCFLIVQEHVFLIQFFHIENTEFIENMWHQLIPKFLMNALIWLELFFILSGLLLYIKFEKSQYITPKSSFQDCLRAFARLLYARYLRYLPSLLFVIIFSANLGCYYNTNSLARSVLDPSCLSCRKYWWQNILMINNYYMENSCLMHTWYIAADFQLYGLFLIILIIMAKFPKSKVLILTSVGILAAVINFGLNYILKLDSIFMLPPDSYRHHYFRNIETCKHLYFSSYTNIHSFLLGMVCGFIYMKYLRNNPANKERLGKILQKSPYVGWLVIVGILYLGTRIMTHTETTIWTAAYGLLLRHVGLAILCVTVILRGMCIGGGFLEYAPFRFLSRISFQVYLWQILVLMGVFTYFNEPVHLNYLLLCLIGVFLYVTTNVIAFLVALFMEYPIAELISIIGIEDIQEFVKIVDTSQMTQVYKIKTGVMVAYIVQEHFVANEVFGGR